jgi:hypothetical protein
LKLFNFKHLSQVEESYLQHFKFSVWAGISLCFLGMISLIHAIFPFMLSRYPDKLFHRFIEKSFARRNRVDTVLKKKNLE